MQPTMSYSMSYYTDAERLVEIYNNLNLGVGTPQIVIGPDNEPAQNIGPAEYMLKVGQNILNVGLTWQQLRVLNGNSQQMVYYLAGQVGVSVMKVESILSEFPNMMVVRSAEFTNWMQNGRPTTYNG